MEGLIRLIAGNAHPELAHRIAEQMDIPLCDAQVGRFPDGEIDIKINDDLRGGDCFVVQPLCPPVNENWIELLLLLDCLRRASAGRVTGLDGAAFGLEGFAARGDIQIASSRS